MNFWRWSMFAVLVLIFSFSIMVACGDDDDDDDDDDETDDDEDDDDEADDDDDTGCGVSDICSYVFSDECEGNLGWTSEEDCNDLWLTGCANEADYLLCACSCLAAGPTDCTDWLQNCEAGCWTDYCD